MSNLQTESGKVFLTVDVAVVIQKTSILMIRRAKAPFQDKLVLPGGHVESGEEIRTTAVRELHEEVELSLEPSYLQLLTVLDGVDRDPRPGRRVSVVYVVHLESLEEIKDCKAMSDACELVVSKLADLTQDDLGFDHWQVVKLLQHP